MVSDTGSGIAGEDLDDVFTPFNSVGGDERKGAGLGLSIVKTLVEARGFRCYGEPARDGFQALGASFTTTRIVAMTANAFDEDIEKCRAAGFDSHLSKPVTLRSLKAVLTSMG